MFLCYARVSTLEQDRDDKVSITAQLQRCQGVAKARGISGKYDVSTYVDRGVSGSVPLSQRPEGKKLLAAAGRGDIIAVAKLDRIFRSASDALASIERLKKRGVGMIICDMGIDPIAESPSANFFFGMLALVAQFERERIAERIQEGKAAKKARGGCIGGVPFGFRKEGHGSKSVLVPDPNEQKAIRIATTAHRKKSYMEISAMLADEGLLGRNGEPYGVSAVHRMVIRGRREARANRQEVQA